MKIKWPHLLLTTVLAIAVSAGVITATDCQSAEQAPVIQMRDLPITTAIENLARQSDMNFILEPRLFGNVSEPKASFVWTNVTAEQAWFASCRRMLRCFPQASNDDLADKPPTSFGVYGLRTEACLPVHRNGAKLFHAGDFLQ